MNTQNELGLSQNVGSALMPEVINGKVDARSVHEALEVRSPFTMWLTRRVEDFGFLEGEDYHKNVTPSGRHDFLLTLDMAKELAMVERNEMGRKMRRYFIECEKALAGQGASTSSNPAGLNKLETALVDLAYEHDDRIAKLETLMRPGADWMTVPDWLTAHGYMSYWHGLSPSIINGRMSFLSKNCTHRSAKVQLPIGKGVNFHSNGTGKPLKKRELPTFSPDVLLYICPPRMDHWFIKDGKHKEGSPA